MALFGSICLRTFRAHSRSGRVSDFIPNGILILDLISSSNLGVVYFTYDLLISIFFFSIVKTFF